MQVDVTFICPEIVGPLRSGVYDVPEGTTISGLLEISSSESSVRLPETVPDYVIFLRNGKQVTTDAILSEGDKVYVLRRVFGG